jgi:serine phosphatase RsbU (regulator of sigma subunit)
MEERLIDVLWKHGELAPQQMLDAVVCEIRQFSPHEQHGDITMIIAKCRGE